MFFVEKAPHMSTIIMAASSTPAPSRLIAAAVAATPLLPIREMNCRKSYQLMNFVASNHVPYYLPCIPTTWHVCAFPNVFEWKKSVNEFYETKKRIFNIWPRWKKEPTFYTRWFKQSLLSWLWLFRVVCLIKRWFELDIRVVQKCTKYMISKKSNLPHGPFGIKIHVVGCFDPLRPSGLS